MNHQLFDTRNSEKSAVSIARLTALWAFVEAGLGGVLHAFKVPFTGLLVGGMAVMLITLIAQFSNGIPRKLFKCLIIVLIVKAMVSPHSPLAAYFAVSFQTVLGFLIYGLLKVNAVSILLFAVLSMLESAVQKLIILTLFFGSSFWGALDGLIGSIFKQFGMKVQDAGMWIVYLYLSIYFIGGIIIASLIQSMIKGLNSQMDFPLFVRKTDIVDFDSIKRNKSKKLLIIGLILLSMSTLIFVFSEDVKSGLFAVGKSIFYTVTVLFIWYAFLNPYLTSALKKFLKSKSKSYEDEVLDILSMMPEFKQMAASAWMLSSDKSGLSRIKRFISILIYWTLTLTNKQEINTFEK